MTAVRPPARFGGIKINGSKVKYFKEKSKIDEGWINGGFFVMESKFLNYMKKKGVEVSAHFVPPLHKQNYLKRKKDFLKRLLID